MLFVINESRFREHLSWSAYNKEVYHNCLILESSLILSISRSYIKMFCIGCWLGSWRHQVRFHAVWRTAMPSESCVPLAEQPPADPWPLASHGVLILLWASSSTAVAAEGGILRPQLDSGVEAGPPRKSSSRELAAWHWCGWTAAKGEGSRRRYLWGIANKRFKNVCHPCQTFIWGCYGNRLRHVAWLVVKENGIKREKEVTFRLVSYFLTMPTVL